MRAHEICLSSVVDADEVKGRLSKTIVIRIEVIAGVHFPYVYLVIRPLPVQRKAAEYVLSHAGF